MKQEWFVCQNKQFVAIIIQLENEWNLIMKVSYKIILICKYFVYMDVINKDFV